MGRVCFTMAIAGDRLLISAYYHNLRGAAFAAPGPKFRLAAVCCTAQYVCYCVQVKNKKNCAVSLTFSECSNFCLLKKKKKKPGKNAEVAAFAAPLPESPHAVDVVPFTPDHVNNTTQSICHKAHVFVCVQADGRK